MKILIASIIIVSSSAFASNLLVTEFVELGKLMSGWSKDSEILKLEQQSKYYYYLVAKGADGVCHEMNIAPLSENGNLYIQPSSIQEISCK
ncbi:MAG: hypothetical protein HOO06_08835 [Bdellovibrionaceae bacterium]|jgi:hypothetical protein|nr:hypothetical protein [Pseudobdellovibrionaceae bacterium]